MKSKGGKAMNPTDAYRKELRKKELKRNKKERKKVREVGILKKDPEALKDQIKKLDTQNTEADGALDKTRRHKKRQLEDTLNLVLKKRKEYVDKMKEKGEDPVMFSHLPAPRAKAPGDEDDDKPYTPQDSAYDHTTLNPAGVPPPGKPPMYRPFTGSAPELNVAVPLPPPPPPPPLPVSREVSELDPLSVPVPPPPPAPRLPPKPSTMTYIPPSGEPSTSAGNDARAELADTPPQDSGDDDNDDDDDDDDSDSEREKAASTSSAVVRPPLVTPMQMTPLPPPPPPPPAMRPPPPVPPRLPLAPPGMVAPPAGISQPHFTFPPPPGLPHVGMAYGSVPPAAVAPRATAQEAPPKTTTTNKPFYVKSAAPTATKRPLAQHTPGLTAMVPASVRVRRETAPKAKPKPSVTHAAAPAITPRPPVLAVKPQSIDDSYSAFLEDMKALGAFDEEDVK
ncbi:WW domain-binding protein 11 [Selaginella moellendorffii]|uniref:WW domain-binding protein 11 n=1 Tax=Selaginella moellendorffii TaxID=88036 RepID=UPI000D1C39E3|nr:WW domain-binding protein 11 [Selaginella moellendorffii]|eukprot:XP_024526121.1 WW domain-binding protein 11 [Selaginella moellendorffii]